jgi:outer membrane protein OmpA-like peptidoglycan-associated protein
MKMKVLSVLFLSAVAFNVGAQTEDDNWVKNYSFEDIGTKKLKKDKSIHFATSWDSPTGVKADLFSKKNDKDVLTGTDANTYGHEKPEFGDNYAGVVMYSFGDKQPRTYITTELEGPMKKDQEYCVRFRVSLADNSKYAVNNIGAHLSKGSLNTEDKKSLLLETSVQHSQNKVFNATFGWETICSIYKADGGEKYLTIGNFSLTKDTKSEKVTKPKGVTTQLGVAYYYVDAVEVFILDSVQQCQCEKKTTEKAHVVITEDFSSNKEFTVEQKVDQCKILFDQLKNEVTDVYLDKVNQLVTVLNENPDLKVVLHSHSDKSEVKAAETNETHKDLAKKRADNVIQVLTKAGIDASRVKIKIHDDAEPATTETSEVGKAKNRRVEFHIQK